VALYARIVDLANGVGRGEGGLGWTSLEYGASALLRKFPRHEAKEKVRVKREEREWGLSGFDTSQL
jgi:hypothetical protein